MKASETTREKAAALLKHMYENDVTLGIGDGMEEIQETEHILLPDSFEKLIKEFLGNEYDFFTDPVQNIISIIDTKKKIRTAELYCDVEYGYRRGDFHSSPMNVKYALIFGQYVYINGKYAGTIYNKDAVFPYIPPEIYLIDGPEKLLKKYSDGVLLWQASIPDNYLRSWKFQYRISAPYMIGITNWREIIFYNNDSGELTFRERAKMSYEENDWYKALSDDVLRKFQENRDRNKK